MRLVVKKTLLASPTARGLIQVRRMRQAPGRKPHWVMTWVRHEDATPAERERAAKKESTAAVRTELKADAAQVWKLYTHATYKSGDLPVLAVREALQNSVDAMAIALRRGAISRGRFDVTWNPDDGVLSFADNGTGMDHDKLHNVFLKLGASGDEKRQAGGGSAGGFGVAKAVILGCSPTSEWEIHSRDNFISSEHLGLDVDVAEQKRGYLAGTRVTIKGLNGANYQNDRWDERLGRNATLRDRLADLLAASTLENVDCYLNGAKVKPYFARKSGEELDFPEALTFLKTRGLGPDTRITAYNRDASATNGAYYVRINGLVQHRAQPGWNVKLKKDVVVDLVPTATPGDDDYPLAVSRDELQRDHRWRFEDFKREFEKEALSNSAPRDYDTYHPDGDDSEQDGHATFSSQVESFLADPALRETLGELFGAVRDIEAAESIKRHHPKAAPSFPSSDVSGEDWVRKAPDVDPMPGFDAAGPATERVVNEGALRVRYVEAPPELADRLHRYLTEAGITPSYGTDVVLDDLAHGRSVDTDYVHKVVDDISKAANQAFEPGGNGLADAVKAEVLLDGLARMVPNAPRSAMRNPFGRAAAVKVSTRNYDKRKAKRFLEAPEKAMPLLLAWDATARMVAKEYGLRERFRPGFVLDDNVAAMVSSENHDSYVMVHPDRLREQIKAHSGKPNAARNIAHWLHHMAAHELAHLAAGLHSGHDESFSSHREDMGVKTAHLMPAIELAVRAALKPAEPVSKDAKEIGRLQRQIAKLQAKIETDRRQVADVQKKITEETRPQLRLFKGRQHGSHGTAGLRRSDERQGQGRAVQGDPGNGGGGREPRARPARGGNPGQARVTGLGGPVERPGPGSAGGYGGLRPLRLAAHQVGLFGVAPREGVGDKHAVTTHFRRTKTGKTAIVHEHERAGAGHQVEPTAPPRKEPTKEEIEAVIQHKRERAQVDPFSEAASQTVSVSDMMADVARKNDAKRKARESGGEARAKDTGRKRQEHRDTGQKIGGARKDIHRLTAEADLAELERLGEAHKRCTKEAVLGDFDGDLHKGLGSSPGATELKRALWAAVATRPPNNPAARLVYMSACDWFTRSLAQLHSVQDVFVFLDDWKQMQHGQEAAADITAAEYRHRYEEEVRTFPDGKRPYYYNEMPDEKWEKIKDKTHWRTRPGSLQGDGYVTSTSSYTAEDGTDRVRLYKANVALAVYGAYSEVLGSNVDNIVRGWLKSRERPAFYTTTKAEANRRDRETDWSGLTSTDPRKKDDDGDATKSDKWDRSVRDPKRTGGPAFSKKVTGEALREDFGLRGVEFGNWLDDDDAAAHLHNAYGAFVDLADLMGIDRQTLAHQHQLGLAFGARGKGHASAHYEPSKVVINLTATKGAGTLAHEFAHFFDHMMTARVSVDAKSGEVTAHPGAWVMDMHGAKFGLRATHVSEGDIAPIHPEVRAAMDGVMAAIKGNDFTLESKALDATKREVDKDAKDLASIHGPRYRPSSPGGVTAWAEWDRRHSKWGADVRSYNTRFRAAGRRSTRSEYLTHASTLGDYWERPHELFARAFEAWTEDQLEAGGRLNTYLVDGTRKKYALRRFSKGVLVGKDLEPYPQGEERTKINEAMSNLVRAMATHQTLRKALQAAALVRAAHGGTHPRALHVEAALVDHKAQALGRELEALHARALREVEQATSPLAREEARQAAYNLREAAGGLRWQAVSGADETDLPRR